MQRSPGEHTAKALTRRVHRRRADGDNQAMDPQPHHRCLAVDAHRVPGPFRTFAVRSDEPVHAHEARAPYGRVHLLRTDFLDAASLARLVAEGRARITRPGPLDVTHAPTTIDELAAAAQGVPDLVGALARALQATGVLGDRLDDYRRCVATRIDYLAACGAGFHNDVARHWSRCLFWVLALDLDDVEFVMPHAGLRLAMAPGDLLVFDPAMAHGLCRPADAGQALARSFSAGLQLFLTGELPLSDAHWKALGAPWRPVEWHERCGALDLMVAEFDDRSGTIQRPGALRDGMKRSTCHVDDERH